MIFSKALLRWHKNKNTRDLPWKREADVYKIWLSEIMLQQTRAEAVIPFYEKFISRFPTIVSLANADEQEIFAMWQGLGYYNRCRNMIATAKIVAEKYNGKFPNLYEKIIELPGIGKYTAAAISSFGFGQPYPVIDGNVYRIYSRFFAYDNPIDTTEGVKTFTEIANQNFDAKNPALFNQAIMDFGASICKPKAPLCSECFLQKECKAFDQNLVDILPIKQKKIIKKNRHFHFVVIEDNNSIYLQKRTGKDIWQDLFSFPMIESDGKSCRQLKKWADSFSTPIQINQVLTHQVIHGYFYKISIVKVKDKTLLQDFQKVSIKKIKSYAFPKMIAQFFEENYF
jgi:A/G-specific adenine glycosylase